MAVATRRSPKHVDLKRRLKPFYTASAGHPALLDIPPAKYLMIDGQGAPGTAPEFQEGIQALFTLSFGLKFHQKRAGDVREFPIMALEGQFWAPGNEAWPGGGEGAMPPASVQWTLMIAQPGFVTSRLIGTVCRDLMKKKTMPALSRVRLERLAEGKVAQILHVGPYDAEAPTIARLHEFIRAQGLSPHGRHHEIYLNDPRRVGPARTKTIIRQPVRRAH